VEPLKTAVQNWKTVWDEIREAIPREAWSGMGFETAADSYWTLTKLLVQRCDPLNEGTAHNNRRPSDTSNMLDFMPLKTDTDEQGSHLRRILRGLR